MLPPHKARDGTFPSRLKVFLCALFVRPQVASHCSFSDVRDWFRLFWNAVGVCAVCVCLLLLSVILGIHPQCGVYQGFILDIADESSIHVHCLKNLLKFTPAACMLAEKWGGGVAETFR